MDCRRKAILNILADLASVGGKADAASVPCLRTVHSTISVIKPELFVHPVLNHVHSLLDDIQQGEVRSNTLYAPANILQGRVPWVPVHQDLHIDDQSEIYPVVDYIDFLPRAQQSSTPTISELWEFMDVVTEYYPWRSFSFE